jgi:hypothetical protein
MPNRWQVVIARSMEQTDFSFSSFVFVLALLRQFGGGSSSQGSSSHCDAAVPCQMTLLYFGSGRAAARLKTTTSGLTISLSSPTGPSELLRSAPFPPR